MKADIRIAVFGGDVNQVLFSSQNARRRHPHPPQGFRDLLNPADRNPGEGYVDQRLLSFRAPDEDPGDADLRDAALLAAVNRSPSPKRPIALSVRRPLRPRLLATCRNVARPNKRGAPNASVDPTAAGSCSNGSLATCPATLVVTRHRSTRIAPRLTHKISV